MGVLLILLGLPSPGHAFCGFYVAKADTDLFNQSSKVVLVRDRNRTILTMANDYRGEPEEFALVVPVPTFIERQQIHVGDRAIIDHLDAYSAPRLVEYHDQVQNKNLWQFDSLTGISRMRDMTLGIVGFGKIGQAVARRARGFGMTMVAYDPYPNEGVATDLDVQFRDLPELLAAADIISLNCGLSTDNEHLIDARAFQQMRRNPILINCARGRLVDEAALAEALDTGQVSGAGLDVLSDESPDLRTSKFTGRSNVILTPHVAFYSDASILENRKISASNIRNFLDGKHENVRHYIYDATR